jgi:hypothetical protein
MNKELMLKWAEALESGKYGQFRDGWGKQTGVYADTLNEEEENTDCYCCLNVAKIVATGTDIGDIDPMSRFSLLTAEYGLNEYQLERFVEYNDTDMLTFPQIAKHIRNMVEQERANAE